VSRGPRQDQSHVGRLFLFAVIAVSLAHLALLAIWLSGHPASATKSSGRAGGAILAYVDFTGSPWQRPSALSQPKVPLPSTPTTDRDKDPSIAEPIAHPEDLLLPPPRADREPEPVPGAALPPGLAAFIGPPEPPDPCHLARDLQNALQNNDRAQEVLASIPQEARSVANAVMVWDGRWISLNMPDGEARLEPVRETIIQTLSASSADCQDRLNTGPILFAIAGPTGTTVLALGSGPWRASEIIERARDKK
jgi:hypothetical protein